tara:strand:- start:8315 stop:8506 length:192 start_codon:yes stop_codon:yes gene_type:complete
MIGLKTQIIDEESKLILKKSLGMFISKLHEKHHNNIIDDDNFHHSMNIINNMCDLLYLKHVEE